MVIFVISFFSSSHSQTEMSVFAKEEIKFLWLQLRLY